MKLAFRSKFIFANVTLVLLTMLVLATVVIQGLIHYNFDSVQRNLTERATEAVLYIQQEIKAESPSFEQYDNVLKRKSLSIAENLSSVNYTRVLLHDAKGNFITDSANVETSIAEDVNKEIERSLTLSSGKSLSVYKRVDDISRIFLSTPIYIDNTVIGVITFIYSLELMDTIIDHIIKLFIVTCIISLVLSYILSRYITHSLLKPIRLLVESTKKISQGNYTEIIQYEVDDEVGELTHNFNQMIFDIADKITKINDEKQKLSSIISSIDDGIFAVGLKDNILMVNNKAKDILDLGDKPVTAEVFNQIPFIKQMVKEVLDGKSEYIQELDYEDKHLYSYSTLIMNNDKNIGVLVVIRDITKMYALESEQKNFISNVSHELRTPLTTIIGYTDLLNRRGTDNPELLSKSLNTINSEGQRLLRLVNDLLSLSKYERADFKLILTSVDINTLLEDVINQMKIKSLKYNVDIDYKRLELPTIRGDYDRLKQVFINILDNAIKYSNPGDIINVVAINYDDYVEISIRDHGPGIPEENLSRIFDAFYRVEEDRSRQIGGTGLGLSIVKSIVGSHNGHVRIESKTGEGTMVAVKLLLEKI
ncbi:ATP-binding protein [Alkalibaculum bacchi]|uniref:sensor histidine kinase n=1 Tax=Alkalibaculum bacchi TaxID=645887 RepID=UPI0026EE71D2|nr:ATP-binding protein [Alkalibaculum bacchi]